jgi:hypothetical protein
VGNTPITNAPIVIWENQPDAPAPSDNTNDHDIHTVNDLPTLSPLSSGDSADSGFQRASEISMASYNQRLQKPDFTAPFPSPTSLSAAASPSRFAIAAQKAPLTAPVHRWAHT